MNNLVKRARLFAKKAHDSIGQMRKYTGEPYWKHPQAVAAMVAKVEGSTPEMIAAAELHDLVEDTPVTLEDIRRNFGDTVAKYVSDLTDISKPSDGNREERKAIDRAHTAKACREAKTIKLADLINNATNISRHDKDFAITFLREKRMLLEFLKEGDPDLYKQAWDLAYEKDGAK